jgi:hypothetical protein
MKFVHKTKHAKRYVYHKFYLEVPEIAHLFEKDGEDWVKMENESRKDVIAELKATEHSWGDKKTKKEIKEDLKQLERRMKTDLKPATIEDWKNDGNAHQSWNVILNRCTGSFELVICREMTAFDKLRGANNRMNAKVRRWEDVVVSEKVIPADLPVKPMTKQENQEADYILSVQHSVYN